MIKEVYVSYETSKLLKEMGFSSDDCHTAYDEDKVFFWYGDYSKDRKGIVDAPTQALAMKWLREVHNLAIEPYRTACGYLYTVSSIPYGSIKYDNFDAFDGDDDYSGQWTTWEKACEDGIKYCLENLI